jgi:hypothetical protein
VLLILSYSILTGLECLLGAATVRIESIRLASEPPHPQPIFIHIQTFITEYGGPTKLNTMLLSLAAVTGLALDLGVIHMAHYACIPPDYCLLRLWILV